MFGKRPDGRRLRTVDPMQLITGFLMKKRYDSMNMYEDTFNCESWDKYIKEKEEEGIKLGYMHIFIAGAVRMLAKWPRLNRFVMNGKIYARPKIWVSFTIHPELHVDCPDTTIKLCFEGTETILEIAEKINESGNNTTRFAVFTRSQKTPSPLDKRFIMLFTVNNEAGSLGRAISVIGQHGFNLLALKSRPTKELIWDYYFYVEGEGNINSNEGKAMLNDLKDSCSNLKVLSSFEKELKI